MTQSSPQSVALPRNTRLNAFARREDGSLIIFSLFMFVLMLMIAGISLDVERFETVRTKIQATADGAALSAASLSQDVPATEMVENHFEVAGLGAFLQDVHVVEEPGSKAVTVESGLNVPTHFMNMIGINNLSAPVSSMAAESVGNIEISLVLDVSGSMGWNGKLGNLKTAGKDFIDTIYSDVEANTVSTSIVPYNTQVSIGPDVLQHMGDAVVDGHTTSHCLNFGDADFDTTALDLTSSYDQTMHFDARSTWWDVDGPLRVTECTTNEWAEAMVLSQNTTDLKNYIDQFQAGGWTSIELGTKWGAALLDPSMQPVVDGMVADTTIDTAFTGRPAAFNDIETLKVMVVMTDGVNTNQHEVLTEFRGSNESPVWVHTDAQGRPYYNVWTGKGKAVANDGTLNTKNDGWYLANDYSGGDDMGLRDEPFGGQDNTNMTFTQLWEVMPVRYFIDEVLVHTTGVNNKLIKELEDMVNKTGRNKKDPRLLANCTAAKESGVVIYAIGFEAPASSELLLQQCASSHAHFYDVAGAEISTAFASIAADISRLRLMN